jgi:signal transduction histidine kinase
MTPPDPGPAPTLLDTLRLVAAEAPVTEQLASICRTLEHERPEWRASILRLEGTQLRPGAGPSLDPIYCSLIDGVEIGPEVGSCGSAAFLRTRVVVADIATDHRWRTLREVAARFDLGACWSEPILDGVGDVLGTFAIYLRQPGEPAPEDLAAIERVADVARIVLERQRRQRVLAETQSWLDLALDAARAGLWDWHVPTGRITASAGYFTMLGIDDPGVPLDLPWFVNALHPLDRDPVMEQVEQQVAAPEGRIELEFRLRHAGGGYRWIRSTGRALDRDAAGRPVRMIGQHVDITERRAIEQREREISDRLRKISANAPAMLYQFRLDAAGELSMPYVSDGVLALFGCMPAEAMADPDAVYRHVHPDDLAGVWAATGRSHARLEPWRHEFRVALPGQSTRWVLGHATPEREPDGSVIWHGAISDITDQKQLEDRLIESSEAANAASRAKTAFITNLSHELRTPLTSILGFVDLMRQGLFENDPQAAAEAHETIRRNGQTLLRQIDDMLELAGLESRGLALDPLPVDPRHVVDEAVEAERERAEEKGLALDVVHDTAVPELIETDQTRLRQVLGHLLDNAIRFTDTGRVTVRLSVHGTDGTGGTGGASATRLHIAVGDTGVGMDRDELDQAFDAFTQGDVSLTREHGGAGLGLRIARALVRHLGGDLRAASAPGEGSTFTVMLPVAGDGIASDGHDRQEPHDLRDLRDRPDGPARRRPAEPGASTRDLVAAMDLACPSDFGVIEGLAPDAADAPPEAGDESSAVGRRTG